jgi:hypothetical protein
VNRGILIGALAFALPVAAQASGGSSSSATTTITLIIPPLQAGLDATNEGAVGLWTLDSATGGLMVRITEQITAGESSNLDIVRAGGSVFDVSLPQPAGLNLAPHTASLNNGLLRQSYVLSSLAATHRDSVQVMIGAI